MTWLKLITNALWTGVYGALLVAFLFFFLNDELADAGLFSKEFGCTLGWSLGIYTLVFALLFPTLYVCLRFFAARKLQIPWFSLKVIVWLGIAVLLTMTIIYYRNLRLAGALLSPSARDALRILCATMACSWLLALTGAALAQRRTQDHRSRHRVAAGLLVLAPPVVMAFMAPFMARTPTHQQPVMNRAAPSNARSAAVPVDSYGPPAPEPRLLFIGLDAATLDVVLPLVSARQLPTFERLIKDGASARLDSLRPCSPTSTWATVMTGMPPWETGVKGRNRFVLHTGWTATALSIRPATLGLPILEKLGLLSTQPASASGWKRPSMLQRLKLLSIEASVIGWEGTRRDAENAGVEPGSERVGYRLSRILGPAQERTRATHAALEAVLRQSIAADLSARDAAGRTGPAARLVAVRFPGLARVSRVALRYHLPGEFGDVHSEEIEAFGQVLSRYYQFLDEMTGELMAKLGSDGAPLHVMVVSSYGIAPASGWERFIAPVFPLTGQQRDGLAISGTWTDGPDGILLAHGSGVAPGSRLEDAGLLDVLPTALYLLGAPVGDDLRGQLLRRLFTRDYLESHPVQIVRGYGG